MTAILNREFTYLYYYFSVQFMQIAPYWALGIVIGSFVSVFGKSRIHSAFLSMRSRSYGIWGIAIASMLGIVSPLCMYGTIPIVASFSEKGMRDDWLAAFMVSSILLNPQLLIYSAALGKEMLLLRFFLCFLCGVCAGLSVRFFANKEKGVFLFGGNGYSPVNRDICPFPVIRLLLNLWRNIKATGPYFCLGLLLTALYQRYVPQVWVADLLGTSNRGFGVLIATTLGVPLYVCGGGTIPLIAESLRQGMSPGSAVAFMVSGPATKITNLSALKVVFSSRKLLLYLSYIIVYAFCSGVLVDSVFRYFSAGPGGLQ